MTLENNETVRILLVEDDEDDYVIFRDTLLQITGSRILLEWVSGYGQALEKMTQNQYDIYFVDYRLGDHSGLDLLRAFQGQGFDMPVIILTGHGDYEIDIQAMKVGASDYLEKEFLNPSLLDRSIRYSLERSKTIKELSASREELRFLSRRLLEVQENERKLVAQELHDSIGSSLSAIKFTLEQKAIEMDNKALDDGGLLLDRAISMVRSTMEEVRRISTNLRPPLLDNLGILTTIRSHCREFQEVYSDTKINSQLDIKEEDVPDGLKIVIFRILQEALNNAAKYSKAKHVRVSLKKTGVGLEFSLEDDGKGFDLKDLSRRSIERQGMGISGMRERVELSDGFFKIISEKGRGTLIRAFWPTRSKAYITDDSL
ncbi:ATPase/histidine kinase/DNA gyrase B/HSP90 domain protein [uncultured Desulfobacterium sp.]|uniref:histidine kinase n=1 Tax=uncultured Desulfobacterium sp. TaxID=201089 RepID=A0A445MR87_9BACT|nr:ATPase/histidine kinase/DNA gyrase B/HSP90 domain protein [uncultured Desulfobacterium sp.]